MCPSSLQNKSQISVAECMQGYNQFDLSFSSSSPKNSSRSIVSTGSSCSDCAFPFDFIDFSNPPNPSESFLVVLCRKSDGWCNSGSCGSSPFFIEDFTQLRTSSRACAVFAASSSDVVGAGSPLRTSGGKREIYFFNFG